MNKIKGDFVNINKKCYYKISNSENMKPFFINVVSASDVWMFLSSKGGVTAGRKNSLGAVFPYETDDRLHWSSQSGSRTIIRIDDNLWEPFEKTNVVKWNITQNIYKSIYGNSVMFEEINHDLHLSFLYKYENSEKYGVIKTSEVKNISDKKVNIDLVDGLQDIIPCNVNPTLQATSSTLVDSYKANEIYRDNIAIYSLTTLINDTPNPLEILAANIAWTTKKDAKVALSSDVLGAFCRKEDFAYGQSSYGTKGGYFVSYSVELDVNESESHSIVVDNNKIHSQIIEFKIPSKEELFEDIDKGTEQLVNIVALSDGLQNGGDKVATNHHYLNTLYNVMRGGIFEDEYEFEYDDFVNFIKVRNTSASENLALLDKIKSTNNINELKEIAKEDSDMHRLALEYMPLSFSRRHGDPSRPWNAFNINVKDMYGNKIRSYEGNWRDIFQNWEALGLSFPCYYENMVAKFVNASTIDGFNPYRINRNGIDWEKPEPDNPFGGLGYWGDHQIIYLLRLLKGLENHFPEKLSNMLNNNIFAYANVPYHINSYDKILEDSKNTIYFDFQKDEKIENLCHEFGSDARLLLKDNKVYTVSLTEKLLVPLLSKVSNLLPGGGIWMNTQRPEWNDANNAIVGIGLSMVTVYHLQAYILFMEKLFDNISSDFEISNEVCKWLSDITKTISQYSSGFEGKEKDLFDIMGNAFSEYREKVYANGFTGKKTLTVAEIKEFLASSKDIVDFTVNKNKNEVYSTYNLLNKDFTVSPMRSMLEGQSAIIGSGTLSSDKVCNLLDEMKKTLLKEDFGCHYLYPIKKTTPFINKNTFETEIKADNKIIIEDINNKKHFTYNMIDEKTLKNSLLNSDYSDDEKAKIKEIYENIFAHNKFTGRSEVMYKYEGIGCVYWHQNAKLALAVLESAIETYKSEHDADKIYAAYKKLTDGFIYRKSPDVCLAIPIEPYSHSSYSGKSEQPGMTGQVKESVIMRRGN